MMNGKKSYLISFTALFSKKGYELTIGFEQIIQASNQYHLTAPVNSTYRTLIEDTMKSANKVPHSATGLFGRLGSAEYVTPYDGFEVETVVASIVSYLSGIHKYFNGETVTDVTTEEQQCVRRLEQVFDAEGAAVSEGSRIDQFSLLDEMSSGDLYDVKVSVEEGNRVSISLSNKQSIVHVLESAISGTSYDTHMGGMESAENGVRLNVEEGRAILSNIVRSILDGEIALSSIATHDPNINLVGELSRTETSELGFYRAMGETSPLEYAVLVSEGSEQGYELAEIAVKKSSLEDDVLADPQLEGSLGHREKASRKEVTEDAFVSRTEMGRSGMVSDAQTGAPVYAEKQNEAELTLTTLADTYGGEAEIHEYMLAETLHSEPALLSKFVLVYTHKDADLETFTEVHTYQNADAQEFIQTDVVMQASQQSEAKGELIQPIYDGQVKGVMAQGENIQHAEMQDSLMYETLIYAHVQTDEQTAAVTYENGQNFESLSMFTSFLKEARIESTQPVDTSVSADMQEFLTYDTRQESKIETLTKADSWANSMLLIEQTLTADTRYEGGLPLEMESVKVEMEYLAGIEKLEQSYYYDKHIAISSLSGADSIKNATENSLTVAEYTSDTNKAGRFTDASSAIGDNAGYLELFSQGLAIQEYRADIHVDDFTHVTYVSGDAVIQLIHDAEVYVDGNSLVDRFMDSTKTSDMKEAGVEEWTEAGMTERVQAELESLYTFEQIHGAIAESPEILKAVRLMEIMYGSKAADFIEAGMGSIIQDSITQGFTRADFPAITQTVIEKMKQAGSGVTVIASNQNEVQAEHNKGADLLVESPTTGRYVLEPQGTIPQEMLSASLLDLNRTGDITEISKAIAEANKHIGIIQKLDTGEQKSFGEGIKPTALTAAEPDITRNGVIQFHETALSDPMAEGAGTRLETALSDPMAEGVRTRLETALSDSVTEGVSARLETGSAGLEYEGIVIRPETAAQEATHADGIMQNIEMAVQSNSKHVGYEHKPETAFNNTSVDGVRQGISLGELRTDRDVVIREIEGARISDGNSPTSIQELESAWQSDVAKETVLGEEVMATFTDKGYEAVVSKIEGATHSETNDAIVAGIEGATFSSSEDAVVHQGETAEFHDGSTISIIHENESAYIDDSSKVGTISEMEVATTTAHAEAVVHNSEEAVSDKETDALIQAGELAEYSPHQDLAVIEQLESGTRKRLQLETDIQDNSEVTNNREPIETHISEPEEAARPTKAIEVGIEQAEKADRPKRVLEVDIDQADEAERPKRVIETTIEKSEGGMIKTPEEPKKPRIWLIIGKIASWSIWNWKKTR
ncbi:hypothetical protein [Paenibacillus sp. TSA_86.1]|uniref:hypothetical protein n=1 Tax=Paenibacillus sp. TSA_86.1 TaxID=3415649 RepID=UPI004045B678